MKNTRI